MYDVTFRPNWLIQQLVPEEQLIDMSSDKQRKERSGCKVNHTTLYVGSKPAHLPVIQINSETGSEITWRIGPIIPNLFQCKEKLIACA